MYRHALFCLLFLVPWSAAAHTQSPTDATEGAEASRAESAADADRDDEAAEGEEPENRYSQELIVTATHPEFPSRGSFSGEEVRDAGSDVGGFFRGRPGLAAARRGPVNLDPSVRGLQETEVGVFVDGTRTFAAGPARMDSDLSHVSPAAVERIEVVKGPYALTWGAGTLAAIELRTFRPQFGGRAGSLDGRASLGWSENGSLVDGGAALWSASERYRFHLALGSRTGDDYEAGDGGEVAADFESLDSRWDLGFQLAAGATLDYSGGYQEQNDIDYAGRLLDATYFYTRSHSLEASWVLDGSIDSVLAQAYVNRKDHRMNNDEKPTAEPNPIRVPPFALDVDLPTESNTAGGKLRIGGGQRAFRWTAGADFYDVEQRANRTVGRRENGVVLFEDVVWPEASIEDLGLYLQGIWRRDRSSFAATLRVDTVDVGAGEVSEFFLENTTGELDQSETNWSAALSAAVALNDDWSLTVGAGRAVRTASVLERYSDRFPSTKFQIAAEFMGSPELEPEEALQVDAGVAYRTADRGLGAEIFYRRIDQYITVQADPDLPKRLPLSPDTVYRYINGDEAEFYGGELRWTQSIGDRWSWRAEVAYVRGEDRFFDEPVFGLAPLTGSVGVRRETARLWVDLNALFVDRQDRVAVARLEHETPGYELVDLAAGWRLGDDWELRAGVRNLADTSYSDHLNALNPFTGERILERGRSAFASARVFF